MAIPKANQRAVNKYVKNNYDRINVTMPKGQRDVIKDHADAQGESTNAFINRAIDETMERDKRITPGGSHKTKADKMAAMARLMELTSDMPKDIDPDKARDERLGASEIVQRPPATSRGGGVVSLPSEAMEAAQEAAEKAGETVSEFIGRAVTVQVERDRLLRSMKPKRQEGNGT